jgi:serine protease Do
MRHFGKEINMSQNFVALQNFSSIPLRLAASLLVGSALGTAVTVMAISNPSLAASAPPIAVTPSNPQAGFAPLVARVKPAVVQIAAVSGGGSVEGQQMQQLPDVPGPFGEMLRRYFEQQGRSFTTPEQRALGSGFIIDPSGYIVTNNHVIDGAREVSVTLTDGQKYQAKVIGRDAKTDLALVKIDAGRPLSYVAFGDSDNAREGDWVIAVGNPFGLSGTVTAGIISAHGRNIDEGPYDDFLQIDAPINPGNSGGPLFNQSGQVVGIDTAIYSPTGGSVGIGFAIPSNVAKSIVNQLREKGAVTRGWLGVAMQPLTPSLAKAVGLPNEQGVLIDSVTPASPAAKSDLHQGDVLTGYDGKPIKDARELAMAVAETPGGKTVRVTIWRDNHFLTVDVAIRPQDETKVASAANTDTSTKTGMSLSTLTPDVREQLNLPPTANGVLVGEVQPGSPADESGIQPGDVIARVANKEVHTPEQIADAISVAEQQRRQALPLLVMRDGVPSYLGLQLQS